MKEIELSTNLGEAEDTIIEIEKKGGRSIETILLCSVRESCYPSPV